MKTKIVEINGYKFTIWKMNLGFKTDYQGSTTKTSYSNVNGKSVRNVEIDNGKIILNTLIYGIYSCEELGILPPKDLSLGFTEQEIVDRTKKIRTFDFDTDLLFEEINKINGSDEDEAEVLKK